MDYKAPENFIEFKPGWYKGIDFDSEVSTLLMKMYVNLKKNSVNSHV